MFEETQGETDVHKKVKTQKLISSQILTMNNDKKNYRAMVDSEGTEEYDHGFDQFLDEEEIDITTFVLPPLPKCSICDTPYPFENSRTIFKQC